MMEQASQTMNEDDSKLLFEKVTELIELTEAIQKRDMGLMTASPADRPLIVGNPLFVAIFEQLKFRYRNHMTPATTVLMVATIVRNFSRVDELNELGLADAVTDFMKMMAAQNGMELPDEQS